MTSAPTVRDRLRAAAQRLRAAGVEQPVAQARQLLAHALGISAEELARRDPASAVDASSAEAMERSVRRRVAGEPLQHVLGRAMFGDLRLAVGPGVFVPRPETEGLLELVLDAAPRARLAMDLGAGSGAIALGLARRLPGARVVAVERSAAAIGWLRRNAEACIAAGDTPVTIVPADFTEPGVVRTGPLRPFAGQADVVVSNPPYVPLGTPVAVEVHHDPPDAVFAGPDGLSAIRALLPTAAALLSAGGLLALEHDETHQSALLDLLGPAGFEQAAGHRDLTRRPRYITARRIGRG